jgi:hypothetical protein
VPPDVLPVAFAGIALAAEDVLSYSDFFGPRPSALPFGLPAGSTGSYGTVMTVGLSEQSAHPYSQALSFAVAEAVAAGSTAGGPLTAQAMNQLVEAQPTAAGATRTLQVKGVAVTGGGVRVRFNQAVDLGRLAVQGDAAGTLRSTQVVVLRGDRVVPGMLIPDPDGAGFSFIPEGGPLPRGEYTLLLRSGAGGVVNTRGDWLDGDYDGQAGGDYRARFSVDGLPLLQADRAAPPAGEALLSFSSGEALKADPPPQPEGDWLLHTLLGGAGGASMLMASLGPWSVARPAPVRRARAPRRLAAAVAPVRIRSTAPAAAASAATRLDKAGTPWLSGWLDAPQAPCNDWRIRL